MSANAIFYPQDPLACARIALRCLDLTSLNDDDTEADIAALCQRAQTPFGPVAAVCVWPRFVAQARRLLPSAVRVAAVASFPEGRLDVARAVADVHCIVAAGGNEVDVVLPYTALAQGQHNACAEFLAQVRVACGPLTLKVIIESGVLQSPALITQATQLALAAGADFVKTSTGKTAVSATPEAAATMLAEIARADVHPNSTSASRTVGFKASGGIRTVDDTMPYIALVTQHLGPEALAPDRFRIGASSLLGDILAILTSGEAPPANTAGY